MNAVQVPVPLKTKPFLAPTRKVGVTTLGCKVNAYESALISQSLCSEKWQTVSPKDTADLYVINTCTVTKEADRQARQAVRRAIRRNPEAMVVVTGCYAQMDPEACAAIPGVDLVLGNDRKLDLHNLLPQLQQDKLPQILVGDVDEHVSLPNELLAGYEGQTRAFVQVQQGCNQSCTFCIIHKARGPSRSFPRTLITRQVQRLVMNGYKEIVICGVDLGFYGLDLAMDGLPPPGLIDLLQRLVALPGDFQIRLSSIDPSHIDDALIDLLASENKLCNHLHLSLQSGNTLILKRMKRRYTRQWIYDRVGKLRSRIPDLVLSADIMVGFPTESEVQFNETLQMVEELEIAYPHTFCYSPRQGTPAARIPKQVSREESQRRAAAIRACGEIVREQQLNHRCGASMRVLVEGGGNPPKGYLRARSQEYFPVWVPQSSAEPGEWLSVEILSADKDSLIAHHTP